MARFKKDRMTQNQRTTLANVHKTLRSKYAFTGISSAIMVHYYFKARKHSFYFYSEKHINKFINLFQYETIAKAETTVAGVLKNVEVA